MESNWRFGVWQWGWADTIVELAARLVTPIGARNGVVLLSNGSFRYAALALAPGQVPQLFAGAPKPDPTAGFPYGTLVFPD